VFGCSDANHLPAVLERFREGPAPIETCDGKDQEPGPPEATWRPA
jgi:hypothetical protein